MADAVVSWTGSLLWPRELPDAAVIDVSTVEQAGVWLADELRQRGRRRLIGASLLLRTMLTRCEVPVLWYRSVAEAQQNGGVTPSERAGLFDDFAEGSDSDDVGAGETSSEAES